MKGKNPVFALMLAVLLTGCAALPGPLDRQEPLTMETEAPTRSVPPSDAATTSPPDASEEETLPEEETQAPVPEEREETSPEETAPEEEPRPVTEETEAREEAPQRETVSELPYFYQTDYPGQLYGDGTLEENGGSAACISMVASYMLGCSYTPSDIASYFGGKAQTDEARLEYAADALGLAYSRAENLDVALLRVREGKPVIVMLGGKSPFCQPMATHFVLITGIGEDGLIQVRDPYRPHYGNWYLKPKFASGFQKTDLVTGYQAAWVFDPDAMPENPPLYTQPERGEASRYGELTLTQEERELFAKVLWGEARGEPPEGQQAVAEVILNRLCMDGFPNTLSGVVNAAGQFGSKPNWYKATPNQTQYDAIDGALFGPYILPENVTQYAPYIQDLQQWGKIGTLYFYYQP